jgi:hypothetical protein
VVAGPPEQQAEQRELPPVTQSREELMALPVKELKGMLKDRGIDLTGKAPCYSSLPCTRRIAHAWPPSWLLMA